MSVKDNPEQHVGTTVQLIRGGKLVKIHLYKVGTGSHFKGTWIGPKGLPTTGIVPFAELQKLVDKEKK